LLHVQISEELLPIHNISARELLHKKQCNLLLLEEHIRTGGLNNPEAAERLREANVVLEAKKMEVVTVAVRAANHVREVVEKTREIQEKTHQIEKLTAERDALKAQLLDTATRSQSYEEHLAAVDKQYKEKLDEAQKVSVSAVEAATKQLKSLHEKDLATQATKAGEQQKLIITEALRKAHAEYAGKESVINAKLHAATEQIAVLKGQVEQLEVVLGNTQQDLTARLAASETAMAMATENAREWELKVSIFSVIVPAEARMAGSIFEYCSSTHVTVSALSCWTNASRSRAAFAFLRACGRCYRGKLKISPAPAKSAPCFNFRKPVMTRQRLSLWRSPG
jgi:myosin heavy subunit